MNRSFAEITEEALNLPQNEQLRLARALLEKAEARGDVGVEAAWEDEIERRIRAIDSGLAKGRPFADVLRDLDRQLGRCRRSPRRRLNRNSLPPWPTTNR